MIPLLVEAGYRVIAPDLIGFGKSDKFDTVEAYSYHKHVDWLLHLVLRLDLQNIILVCQDWGSLLGIRLAADDHQPSEAFLQGQTFSQTVPVFPTGLIVSRGCVYKLSPEAIAAIGLFRKTG